MPQRMSSTVRGGASAATGEAVVPSLAIVLGGALLFALVNGTAGRASAWLAIAATVLAVALVVTLQRGGADIAFGAIADWTLAAVPGLLVVFFSFNGGGFFPGSQGLVAFLLSVALALRIALVPSPFSGISRVGAVAVGCLLLYALVELVSGSWSHAWGRPSSPSAPRCCTRSPSPCSQPCRDRACESAGWRAVWRRAPWSSARAP